MSQPKHARGRQRSAKAERTRTALLEAAERIILGKSFGSVGINEVLKACKVPKGSFYHYFESKEHFGVCLIEYAADKYGKVLDELLEHPEQANARAQLIYFLRFHVDYYLDNGCTLDCLVVKLAGEVSPANERLRQAMQVASSAWTDKFVELIRRGQADGSIAPDLDPTSTGAFLYASWLGANTQVSVSKSVEAMEAFERVVDSLLAPP